MTMTVKLLSGVLCAALVCVSAPAYAQERTTEKPIPVVTPLKVTVVITHQAAGKPVSAAEKLPFELWVNTGSQSTIRMGAEVPIPSTNIKTDEATGKTTTSPAYNFRSIGTNLTVEAAELGDGRYRLGVTLEHNQIMPIEVGANTFLPRAGTQVYRAQTGVILRDGQTVQHSLGTNAVTGETTTISITAVVIK